MKRTVNYELRQLQGVFPDITMADFFELENGNTCVLVAYRTTGRYACGRFKVLIEFPYNYPNSAPFAWVQKPRIKSRVKHVYERDSYGHTKICYLRPKKDWHYSYTSYDAAMMIQTWIYAYCHWLKTGIWDWEQA